MCCSLWLKCLGSPFQNTLNSWKMGTGITSRNFMTNLQDGSLQSRWTVVVSVTPHLVRLPHLPSAAALCCSSLKISCHVVVYWFLLTFLNYVMNLVSSGHHWFVYIEVYNRRPHKLNFWSLIFESQQQKTAQML